MYYLQHVGLAVKDLNKSKEFYCRVLGCVITNEMQTDQVNITYLKAGQTIIELLEYRHDTVTHRSTGLFDHIAFKVEDMNAAVDHLRQEGVTLLFDQPRVLDNGQSIMFFLGPDGERLELVQE